MCGLSSTVASSSHPGSPESDFWSLSFLRPPFVCLGVDPHIAYKLSNALCENLFRCWTSPTVQHFFVYFWVVFCLMTVCLWWLSSNFSYFFFLICFSPATTLSLGWLLISNYFFLKVLLHFCLVDWKISHLLKMNS